MNTFKLLEYYFLIDSEHESLLNLFSRLQALESKMGDNLPP